MSTTPSDSLTFLTSISSIFPLAKSDLPIYACKVPFSSVKSSIYSALPVTNLFKDS